MNSASKKDKYIAYAQRHGFNALYINLGVTLNDIDKISGDISSENPDLAAFDILDQCLQKAHAAGMHIQFWRWGDRGHEI